MKKKFINGILMVAMLFAATTSFVSCKDNVDDEISPIYNELAKRKAYLEEEIAKLQKQIDDIDPRIINEITQIVQYNGDSLKQVITDKYDPQIQALQDELTIINNQINALSLHADSVNTALDGINDHLTELDAAIDSLNSRIDRVLDMLSTGFITSVDVEGTYSPVFGATHMPGVKFNALGSYYGTNETGIDVFPQTGIDFNVGGSHFACYLEPEEIAGETYTFESDYIVDTEGNAGKIFFTVNNSDYRKFDISKYELTLENTVGKVNPMKISNAKKSDAQLVWNMGFNYGYIRTGSVADNGYYEADVTLNEDDLESTTFQVEKFFDLKKKGSQIMTAIQNVQEANGTGAKNIAKQIVREAAAILLDLFNNSLSTSDLQNNPSYSPQRLVFNMEEDGIGVRKGQTAADIFTTALKPLSYNTFYEYEKNKTDNWIIEVVLEETISKIAKEIKEHFETVAITAEIVSIDEVAQTVTVKVNNTSQTVNISSTKQMENLKKAINANGGLANVNSMLNDLLKPISLGSASKNAAERINNYLDRTSNYITTLINKHAFTRAVAPLIIFETTNGVDRLAEGMFLPAGVMHAYLTSATAEILVPAFKKYVAVVKDGEVKQSDLLPGSTLNYDFDLTEPGDYKVILSAVDYYGFVITKKYDVYVK